MHEDFYSILGIPRNASDEELRRAYEEALEMYEEEEGTATYGLLSPEERREFLKRIREGYRVLSNPVLRRKYDMTLPRAMPSGVRRSSVEIEKAVVRGPRTPTPELRQRKGPFDGATLRSIREELGVTIEEISEYTKIGTGTLRFIEEEAFKMLPPHVYLRAFVNQYANYLGLDPQRVVHDYLSRVRNALGPSS